MIYYKPTTDREDDRNLMALDLRSAAFEDIVFKTRVRDESIDGDNPYRWEDVSLLSLFDNKRVILFGLPGAFTPTCSTMQLPRFEELAPEFKETYGIDEIYCMSVNDAFVMNAWARSQNLEHVKVIPDGNLHFTDALNLRVPFENRGFGERCWRFAAIFNDSELQVMWKEDGICENSEEDPYDATTPENVLEYLKQEKAAIDALKEANGEL
jgi:peroxiredoxin